MEFPYNNGIVRILWVYTCMASRQRVNRLCLLLLVGAGAVTDISAALARDVLLVESGRHGETISLSLKAVSPHKVFTLPSPDRLVVDVPAMGIRPDVELPDNYQGKLIKHVRFGQFNPQTWRLVFDLSQPIQVVGEDQKNGLINIQIAAAGESQAKESKPAANTPAVASDEQNQNWPQDAKKRIAYEDYSIKNEYHFKDDKKHTESRPSKSKVVASKSESAASKSEKPVIVIDPGHGGVDPGTQGPDGSYEKNIVLAYAHELEEKLLKTGRYRVILTRDDDQIVMLRKRVDIARKAGALMFISLHADSAPEQDVRGLSVYTVSEKASDLETEALAARENKADVLTGMDLSDEREDVAGILISLAERETKNRSATLADFLVTSLDDKVHLLSNSHRFAGFAVLKAPDVPSVLIEIGFLSHPREEKLINSKAYRDKVTSGIVAGVGEYFRFEKRMGDQ